MRVKFVIPERLPGLNEYTAAMRTNAYKGAAFKKKWQLEVEYCLLGLKSEFKGMKFPVVINYKFYERNRKRDHDNVSAFAHKVIQDAMVQRGLIPNDGWNEIQGYSDMFYVDKEYPRIEVEVVEA